MNASPLERCLDLAHAHARISFVLDDELGTQHGLSFADFCLLHELDRADLGHLSAAALAAPLGASLSGLTRRLLPLEKTGLVQRQHDAAGRRIIAIRPAGRAIVREAAQTAERVCASALPARAAVPLAAPARSGPAAAT